MGIGDRIKKLEARATETWPPTLTGDAAPRVPFDRERFAALWSALFEQYPPEQREQVRQEWRARIREYLPPEAKR